MIFRGALLVNCFVLFFLSCSEDPVRPKPASGRFYLYGIDNLREERALRLDPSSCAIDTVSDSLPRNNSLNVSADGRFLFVCTGDSMGIYTSDSGQYVGAAVYHALETAASPDRRYVALEGLSYLGLTILSWPGVSVLFRDDTLNIWNGTFSKDSRAFYAINWNGATNEVLRLQLQPSLSLQRKAIPAMPGALVQAVPSVDQKLWFLYSRWHWDGCSFGVYDVAGDSLIYRTDFSPGAGMIAVSPDGQSAFFTNGGNLHVTGTPAPSAFYRYDIPTNTVEEISTRGWANDTTTGGDYLPVGPIAITPDGKTLVGVRAVIGSDAVEYDVSSRTITKYCFFDHKAYFNKIVCQVGR